MLSCEEHVQLRASPLPRLSPSPDEQRAVARGTQRGEFRFKTLCLPHSTQQDSFSKIDSHSPPSALIPLICVRHAKIKPPFG